MSELVSNQQRYEILRNPVRPDDINDIILCCNHAWPQEIYPYKGLLNPLSWLPTGELCAAIEDGDMFSSVVCEAGKIIAHAALVKNKFDLWELGRVFTSDPGHGYGIRVVEGALEQADTVGAEFVYMGRSYNRTPMMGVAMKVAKEHGMEIAVIGVSPHLYDEQGNDEKKYIWGEVDSLLLIKGKKLTISLSYDIPAPVRRLVELIVGNNSSIEISYNHQQSDQIKQRIKIDDHIGLVDIQDIAQQEALIKSGCIPVGILPVRGSWYVKFFKGKTPQVKYSRMSEIKPGVSSIYCSDVREYHIINSILNK